MRRRRNPFAEPSRHKGFSPLALIGAAVTLIVVLVGGAVFLVPRMLTHAADAQPNMNCTLIVPPQPLTAQGLATPYQLTATNPADGPCNESNPNQAVFIQGAVIDPATGQISIYNPLVIDKGTQPAVAPVVPQLPRGGIVALWGGGNDGSTTLQSTRNSLQDGRCVNGTRGSVFGQVWFCNAPAFFLAANLAIKTGKLKPPALGMAKDGQPCPTVRDFSVVDQDQSDNVTADYLVTSDGRTAQATAANLAALPKATDAANGSDNRLLDAFIDPALGCTPWMAPDLANKGHLVPAQPLNEIQAAMYQAQPVALVPMGDPMVLDNNGKPNLAKLDAYRVGVDQPLVFNPDQASTQTYCANLRGIGVQRLLEDVPYTLRAPSLDTGAANSLFTFLAQRFVTTYGAAAPGLNCEGLLHQPDPVQVKTDQNGVAVSATIDGIDPTQDQSLACNVNGTVLMDCSGDATINGSSCSFQLDMNTRQVKITCGAAPNN